jgi:hypothetical protein
LHFEFLKPAEGSPKQAWTYATKEETRAAGPWTYGEARDNEKANKSALFVMAVKSGATDRELTDSYPGMMVCHSQSADRIRRIYDVPQPSPERTVPLEVYVFYGPSGMKARCRRIR